MARLATSNESSELNDSGNSALERGSYEECVRLLMSVTVCVTMRLREVSPRD